MTLSVTKKRHEYSTLTEIRITIKATASMLIVQIYMGKKCVISSYSYIYDDILT
jgi:hypothetical protein